MWGQRPRGHSRSQEICFKSQHALLFKAGGLTSTSSCIFLYFLQDDLDQTTNNFTHNGSSILINEMATSILDQNSNAKGRLVHFLNSPPICDIFFHILTNFTKPVVFFLNLISDHVQAVIFCYVISLCETGIILWHPPPKFGKGGDQRWAVSDSGVGVKGRVDSIFWPTRARHILLRILNWNWSKEWACAFNLLV